MRPMLATRGSTVPTGPEWLHEVKWDGMRVLIEVSQGRLKVFSRNENDVTVSFPELLGLAEGPLHDHDVVLDGEVVAFADGIPSFGALAERMHVQQASRARTLAATRPVTLLAFDLLELDGEDLSARPLSQRRTTLQELTLADVHWQVPDAYDDGAMLMEATAQQGLEGIVSKKRSSRYLPGRRTADWLKFPHRPTSSYVVGGWRLETDSSSRIGAVLVGEPGPGGLRYRAGSAAASPARRVSGCSRCCARSRWTPPRSSTRCPASTPSGRRGCGRRWWSTWSRWASPPRGGCANRHILACGQI